MHTVILFCFFFFWCIFFFLFFFVLDVEFKSENPEMWCNMIASDIVWPDAIEEAIPEEYTPNENISSANMIIVSIGSFMACIVALLN